VKGVGGLVVIKTLPIGGLTILNLHALALDLDILDATRDAPESVKAVGKQRVMSVVMGTH
jgi:hypothetical protein